MTFSSSGVDSIVQFGDAGNLGLLLAIGFCVFLVLIIILIFYDPLIEK
jgi:hypothetical protein